MPLEGEFASINFGFISYVLVDTVRTKYTGLQGRAHRVLHSFFQIKNIRKRPFTKFINEIVNISIYNKRVFFSACEVYVLLYLFMPVDRNEERKYFTININTNMFIIFGH